MHWPAIGEIAPAVVGEPRDDDGGAQFAQGGAEVHRRDHPPPGELMTTTSRKPGESATDPSEADKRLRRVLPDAPSATITRGQRAAQPRPSMLAKRKLIGEFCAIAARGPASRPTPARTNNRTTRIARPCVLAMHPYSQLVGGDGLEPPTLSV